MTAPRFGTVCCLLVLLAGPAAAAPTAEEITRAVDQLGDRSFPVREKASVFLRGAGRAAEPALRAALKSPDQEVVRRAREILNEFKWGLYPDTPASIRDLILRYRTAGANVTVKREAVHDLARMKSAGYAVLLKIAAAETEPELQKEWRHLLVYQSDRVLPGLLLEGSFTLVEDMLELGLTTDHEPALRNYAAFVQLRGRLDAKIADWKSPPENMDARRAALVLAYLYRAAGDLDAARAAATTAEDAPLLDTLLVQAGAWKELAQRIATPARRMTAEEQLGYTAAYQRLAGQSGEYEKAVATLRRLGAAEGTNVVAVASALFLNDRPEDALALLREKKSYLLAFEVHCGQHRYTEAFALLEKIEPEARRASLVLRQAAFRRTLGDKDDAVRLLGRVADTAAEHHSFDTWLGLLHTDIHLGLKDLALEHAVRCLEEEKLSEDQTGKLFAALFPVHKDDAALWWHVLGERYRDEKPPAVLRRLRRLLEKTQADDELRELCRHVERSMLDFGVGERGPWLRATAELCLAVGDRELGRNYLEKAVLLAGTPGPVLRLGDLLAEAKEWTEAAERYRQAWEMEPTQPLPLYLRGWALAQSGEAAEGRRLMELAHLLPLGGEDKRFAFAQALAQRGRADEARRERELVLRLAPESTWEYTETLRQQAYDHMEHREFARAADLFERYRLRCLRARTEFTDNRAYLYVPVLVHQNRARALLAAGKLDNARTAWNAAFRAIPGHLDTCIRLLRDLEEADHKDAADELFRTSFAAHEKLCADYPKSAELHNSAAWLAAGCRRELDRGQKYAERAIELEPDRAMFLDTLAEIRFQRGERDQAVELARRCRKLEPANDYYRRQQERFETGAPKRAGTDEGP